MAPAVVDSEDEDAEILVPDDRDTHRELSSSINAKMGQTFDGSNDRRTGSTEGIKHKTHNSGIDLSAARTMSPPKSNRRHTTSVSSEPAASVEKRLKRTRTTKADVNSTEVTAQTTSPVASTNVLDDTERPATLQSPRYSEHSDSNDSPNSSLNGSLHSIFLNHEPMAMFPQTGSTIPDNESSQQKLLQQALANSRSNANLSTSLETQDLLENSPFPWPTSVEQGHSQTRDHEMTVLTDHTEAMNEHLRAEFNHIPQPSPVVEIILGGTQNEFVAMCKTSPIQETSRNRKRKTQGEGSDQLNSEEIAVGLPQERYQPRPTRRRTTQPTEVPVDFSVVPEKAAKRRRKTAADVDLVATEFDSNEKKSFNSEPKLAGFEDMSVSKAEPNQPEVDAEIKISSTNGSADDEKHIKPLNISRDIDMKASVDRLDSFKRSSSPCPSPSKKTSDHIFAKPSLPPPTSSKRSRRSHTTIYEDHVEFTQSAKTPSLKQQQASRKSALRDVQNDSIQRPSMAHRDPDDEDELAKDVPGPQMRGIAQTAKTTSAPVVKSVEKVLDDTAIEPEDDEGHENNEPKPKKGRGRPRKNVAPQNSAADSLGKPTNESVPRSEIQQPAETEPEPESEPESEDANPIPRTVSATSMPTPSPERPAPSVTNQTTNPSAPASSPTSHSPIKSSSKVPLRVGLSKRQRIPSLLRMSKPAKATKPR